MEDRYLFRAKRIDNDEWVDGSYVYTFCEDKNGIVVGVKVEKHWIVEENGNMVLVDEDTICQCTGLKDKNGKLIWENDIVKGAWFDKGKSHRHIGTVSYICCAYKVVGVKQYYGLHDELNGSYTVIGNIFDNPELLESEG